jgi:hypothetical protein
MVKYLFTIIFMLSVFIGKGFGVEDVIDLGEYGFVCPLNAVQLKQEYAEEINRAIALNPINQSPINISYRSNLKKHVGPAKINRIPKEMLPTIPAGTKILILSVNDAQSMAIAPQFSANYALAIDYASLQDIAEFQTKTGVKYPIQPATEDYIKAFKLHSYPALVTIKDNEIEIQEGF